MGISAIIQCGKVQIRYTETIQSNDEDWTRSSSFLTNPASKRPKMPFESNSDKDSPTEAEPTVESSAQLLENDAAKFLSSGSESAAKCLLTDLRDIADKGPDYVKSVFRQMAADSTAWKTLNSATVSESGDFITFQPNFAAGMLGFNYRSVSASVSRDKATVAGQTDRNLIMGMGNQRRIRLEK